MRIEDIPNRVEQIMLKRGITESYLINNCQIQKKLLHDILKDRRYNITLENMQKLTAALGVTLGDFFSPEEEKIEVTAEMQQVHMLIEELSPNTQNRVLGYVQGVAEDAKEKRECDNSI